MSTLTAVSLVILMALAFDFVNGFHDAPNSIATIVATKVLKPFWAVAWAAFFNLIAVFFSLGVATTLGTGLVASVDVDTQVVFAALAGAIIYGVGTWWFGLPSSSTQALIGGLIGAVVAKSGWSSVHWAGLSKVLVAVVLSPLLGAIIGWLLLKAIDRYLVPKKYSIKVQKNVQLLAAALLSIGHGANDAQKTMGIIALVLFSAHFIGPEFYIPTWVILSCNLVMALGTFFGGWRIVKTLAEKITPLGLNNGTAAETSAAVVLFGATSLGIPVSTTHIVTGAITGVGLYQGFRAVNWHTIGRIAGGWLLTIPCSSLLAAILAKCDWPFM